MVPRRWSLLTLTSSTLDPTPSLTVRSSWRRSAPPSGAYAHRRPRSRVSAVRLRGRTQVRLEGGEALGEPAGRVLVRESRRDDHVVAVVPIHRGRDRELRAQLQAVEDTNDLVDVASDRSGVRERQPDRLVRSDDEHCAYRRGR